jgi:hypothetical protein
MPKYAKLDNLTEAQVYQYKFFYLELLNFLLDRKKPILLARPFKFTIDDFNAYLKAKTLPEIDGYDVESALKALNEFGARKKDGTPIPGEKMFKYSISKDRKVIAMKNCERTYLLAAQYIIGVLTNKINRPVDHKHKSYFKIIDKFTLTFKDHDGIRISGKERAVFSALAKRFKMFCKYQTLFDAIAKFESKGTNYAKFMTDHSTQKKKDGTVQDTVDRLKRKLIQLCGNSGCIQSQPKNRKKKQPAGYKLTF